MPEFTLKYCVENIDKLDSFCIYNLASITPGFQFLTGKPHRGEEIFLKPTIDVELKWWTDLNIPRVANHMV